MACSTGEPCAVVVPEVVGEPTKVPLSVLLLLLLLLLRPIASSLPSAGRLEGASVDWAPAGPLEKSPAAAAASACAAAGGRGGGCTAAESCDEGISRLSALRHASLKVMPARFSNWLSHCAVRIHCAGDQYLQLAQRKKMPT